jgi:hypothetical protein
MQPRGLTPLIFDFERAESHSPQLKELCYLPYTRPVKRAKVIMVAAVAIIFGWWWFALVHQQQREPCYGGRALSEWMRLYTPFRPDITVKPGDAADALRHIGTNALPFLRNWVQELQDVPARRQRLYSAVCGWSYKMPGRDVLLELIGGRHLRARRALWVLQILGETARDAVPDLVRVAREGQVRTATSAITALGYLGKDASLPLLSIITNTARPLQIRQQALTSLRQEESLGPGDCRTELTVLAWLLSDSDVAVRHAATNALQLIAPEMLQQSSAK